MSARKNQLFLVQQIMLLGVAGLTIASLLAFIFHGKGLTEWFGLAIIILLVLALILRLIYEAKEAK